MPEKVIIKRQKLTEPKEKFWTENLNELFRENNYTKFYPKREMSRIEQLNAFTRLLMYFAIFIILFNENKKWLYLPIVGIAFVILFYIIHKNDRKTNEKEFRKILELRNEKRINENKKIDEQYKHDDEENDESFEETQNYKIEAGYMGPNNNIIIGGENNTPVYEKEKTETLLTVDEIDEYNKNTCKIPTKDNPLMNTNITDYNEGNPPVACNSYDEDINEEININFNHDLFRNIDELWEKGNSQRQFYTMPNTAVPNNQKDFAEWLYKVPETCKENQFNCLRLDPLKNRRR